MNTKKSNTFGVVFYLKKYKSQDGKAPIYARITVDGKRADVSLKRSVEEKNWNAPKGMAKGSRDEIVKLNTYLEKYRSGIVECYQEMLLQKELITPEAIKNKFLGTDEQEFTLCNLIEYHNTQQKDILAWGTMKNYFTTQKYVQKFLTDRYKTTDIYLSAFNYKFIMDFEHFLRMHVPLDHQKALGNNGVMKHLERLRKMINLGIKMEWIKNDPFASYQMKFNRVDRECLTEEELDTIEKKQFKIGRLDWAKDLFVFSCYTGLAYIDAMTLAPANIVKGIDGELWLNTNRQKTNSVVRVPLLKKPLAIIEKYKNNPKAVSKGTIFPGISNQKLNSYLKEIADLCDIDKNLTFHLARHTFATTVTLTNGVPIETVSKMLGHTKISTTQIYAKVIERKLSEDMNLLRGKLEGK